MRYRPIVVAATLTATALLPIPRSAAAQSTSIGVGDGVLTYRWTNIGGVAPGDTVRVRHVVISTGDSVVPSPAGLCDFTLETTADVRPLDRRCSGPAERLAPGDSAWAERTWIVHGPPGRYDYRILVPAGPAGEVTAASAGTWELLPPRRRRSAATPATRVPVVVRFAGDEAPAAVTARDIDGVVFEAVRRAGYLPVLATPAAARAMTGEQGYLRLDVEVGERGRYALSRCWIGADGRELSRWCDHRTTGGAPPMLLGLRIRDFVDRELSRLPGARERAVGSHEP